MIKNNIEILENFLSSEKNKTLLINQVSDEIYFFYEFVLREFSNKYQIKISNNIDFTSINETGELFGNRTIHVFKTNISKNIEGLIGESFQKIIFTDYKNYKKFNLSNIFINGYNFEKDMRHFIKTHLKINNNFLLDYCISHPYLIFSEVTKYAVNDDNYITSMGTNEISNFILETRKKIYKLKNGNIDIKKLFIELKKEVDYKKFSFLTS